ncbi:hypothetical protein J2S54_004133 [Streptomyces sp. DSM 42143]|uniref:hypothetical protein n=1 Tax=Streptomyces TaxID=1883 RepID=UPI002788F2CA|nr:hypothetical protein [Streptomyces sp. DSM 42143]MDQ0387313.1 hypothetical protein [Streptomyces sp. DSM 42143]
MNRRPTLLAAAAMSAVAALSLSACGGGEESSKGNDKIAGADTGGDSSVSASPSGAASDAANRPSITLPKDMRSTFEGWKTGDPVKDAALADAERALGAVDDAIARGDTKSRSLSYYFQGDALISEVKWVQAWLDENISWTGSIRYFDPQVTLRDQKTAVVVYCADDSKAYNKDRKTGKVDKTPSSDSPYVLYNTRLEKSDEGVWVTTGLHTKRGHEKCGG